VDVTEKDNRTQRLLIGDETPAGAAVYAMRAGEPRVYTMAAYSRSSFDKSLDDLRNKKLFDFGFRDPDKIEMHDGAKALFLTRTGTDWWSNGKKMDADSVQSYLSGLRDLTADKFPDSGFANPRIDITVTSNGGQRVEKVLLAKSGDRYLARRENEPTLYELDAAAVESLQKSADAIQPAAEAPGK
jgi:hypothetical protein